MKMLVVSDLHYTLKQFDWVCQVAEHFDLVAIAGDHLDIAAVAALEAQIVVISKYLVRIRAKTRLLVSSGNHDLDLRNAEGERVAAWISGKRFPDIAIDGQCLDLGDTAITVCPWWDGPVGRAGVAAQLARDAEQRRARWIWIYHAPPDQSPVSWSGKGDLGDAELRGWIEAYQPDIVLTGHIHQSPFRSGGSWADRIGKTWVFNAGRQIGPIPTCIVIDLATDRASWHSMDGGEELKLDQALTRPIAAL
jgi:Icc-related predicted phosphoesterase